jgi:1,2-dihydroxy-3-keto-5-methylthiopentene dioxygenase
MVHAYYMDSSSEDQRLPHQLSPPEPVSLEQLAKIGVLYWNMLAATEE